MPMNIFILEDNNERNKFFKSFLPILYPEAKIIIHEEASNAINALEPNSYWDIILLDHDLGGKVFVDSNNLNTGYQVAKHIKEKGIRYGQCIAHTQNPVGAKNIQNVLKCLAVPFPNLRNSIKHQIEVQYENDNITL